MLKLSAALAAVGIALIVGSALAAPPAQPAQPVPAAQPAPSAAEIGRSLFVAKGCVSCHHHAAIAGSGPFGGDDIPDLSAPRADAEFLRRWLADPAAVRPGTPMPRLGLSDAEITALIAFLAQGKG